MSKGTDTLFVQVREWAREAADEAATWAEVHGTQETPERLEAFKVGTEQGFMAAYRAFRYHGLISERRKMSKDMDMEPGDVVMVYLDPITQTRPEDEAELMRQYDAPPHYWTVRFLRDNAVCDRFVYPTNEENAT